MQKLFVLIFIISVFNPAQADFLDLTGPLEVGVLFGGVSKHHSDKFAPPDGYNENHKTLGIQISQAEDGFIWGISVETFDDSYNYSSKMSLITAGYKKTFPVGLSITGDVGLGRMDKAFYKGNVITPSLKVRHTASGLYGRLIHQPIDNRNLDSLTYLTFGWSAIF